MNDQTLGLVNLNLPNNLLSSTCSNLIYYPPNYCYAKSNDLLSLLTNSLLLANYPPPRGNVTLLPTILITDSYGLSSGRPFFKISTTLQVPSKDF